MLSLCLHSIKFKVGEAEIVNASYLMIFTVFNFTEAYQKKNVLLDSPEASSLSTQQEGTPTTLYKKILTLLEITFMHTCP